jgi:glycosyltransferase involved in cell wall biosynthesis
VTSVVVGIHVHAEPGRLLETLAAVERRGRRKLAVLLLPDGPDRETARVLAGLPHRSSSTQRPLGAPACFNRLAAEADADVVILLESGSVPAAGALARLVAALEGDVGLAGPSTNSAWNDQCAFRDGDDVLRTGRLAGRRFGRATRSLEPLYSLSDFCLAVRRDVIDAIGGADEGYGLGPCWEMEYGARAARAGFRSVWVPGAYVWRAPFTARRGREERRLFDASRRRYQDSMCGLRLRGQRGPYEPHCRGDECEHFAPRELITIARPLARRPTALPQHALPPSTSGPLVSCVMPTRDRAEFALHAIRLFQAQDHQNRELVIVDDGNDSLELRLPDDGRLRYIRAPRGESIGAKRNRACSVAHGEYIAQWDDDDWYGSGRLSAQVAPLAAGRAEMTGLITPLFFDLSSWKFWRVTPELHRRLFVGDVHGGTLVFARHVWERLARYPDKSLAEDAHFLARARAHGARVERIDGAGLFVYLRHAVNAWQFSCGTYLDPGGWLAADEPLFSAADRDFYLQHSNAPAPPTPAAPLVTCIMPTANRRPLVAQSIAYFLRQDYPSRELLVLDDGTDRVADVVPADPRIRYVGLEERLVLGEKRNRACELARGDIIAHWDDDDWQAPHRLSYQVAALEAHGAGVCGSNKALYFDPCAGRAWLYDYPTTRSLWVAGNALCYRKEIWSANPFPRVQVGEDTRFVWSARTGKPLLLPDHRFFVGLVHGANTSRKLTTGAYWRTRPLDEVCRLLGDDYTFYESVR